MMSNLLSVFQRLTGQPAPLTENVTFLNSLNENALNLGYSQFNELLLLLGYDRVSEPFFQFLGCGNVDFDSSSTLQDIRQLEASVDKVIEFSLILFGNIKFGYKRLSSPLYSEEFINWFLAFRPVEESKFTQRHPPLVEVDKIANADTYLLGYIIQRTLKEKLDVSPQDSEALRMKADMEAAIEKGTKNHIAYLASDHMDVYIATSMRQKHEYLFISRIADQIFGHSTLRDLRLRYFDPTQAYCSDRIDKGIAEALMLKRAKCTIYLAQEIDTLGKDSELASTLAQGKTVIAYIPKGDRDYVDNLLHDLAQINNEKSGKEILLQQLMIFEPEVCWSDGRLRKWLDSEADNEEDYQYSLNLLYRIVEEKYNKRAVTLKDTHPLGIQVNLETGVANGVIVTRDIEECATLVRKVLLREMEFQVEEVEKSGIKYVLLKESLTGSVYRVSSGEKLLANTFWNYYLPKSEI